MLYLTCFFAQTYLPLIHAATIIQVNTVFSGRGVEINFIVHSQRIYENLAALGSPFFTTRPKKEEGGEGFCVLLITYAKDKHDTEHL